MSVYSIPDFAEKCSPGETKYQRRLIYPTFVSFLSQKVAKPVAFTPCELPSSAKNASQQYQPLPLTILARSLEYPHLVVHTVLSLL